jgi:HlyD family secretion protein
MRKITTFLLLLIYLICIPACKNGQKKFDATGTFEAEEIIVSAEASGKILAFETKEGDTLSKGQSVARIDPLSIQLQKEQIEATMTAITEKSNDASPQIAVIQQQIETQNTQINIYKQQKINLLREQKRFKALLEADAISRKTVEDIEGQIDVVEKQIEAAQSQIKILEKQISAQKSLVALQNKGLMSEKLPLQKRLKQADDQIARTNVINPISGTILAKYAHAGELTTVGKPLYKIADLSTLTLRAYITGTQLPQVKINQKVKIYIDNGAEKYTELNGTVTWISDKAEFTPKTIQTKDERANLVYATKIIVPNDGTIKIGMYGEVLFQ